MARSPINYCRNQQGLTLIEVLIALAIVAIAMTAIIKATAQDIRGTTYLQNKMIAAWVGQEIMNEARMGVLILPKGPDKRSESIKMLDQDWYWQASREETTNKNIDRVEVNVYAGSEEKPDASPLVTLEGYLTKSPGH